MRSLRHEGPLTAPIARAQTERLAWPAAAAVIGVISLLGWVVVAAVVRLLLG